MTWRITEQGDRVVWMMVERKRKRGNSCRDIPNPLVAVWPQGAARCRLSAVRCRTGGSASRVLFPDGLFEAYLARTE